MPVPEEEPFRSRGEHTVVSPGSVQELIPADGDAKVAPDAETDVDPEVRARELIALGSRGAYSYARQRQRIARTAGNAEYWELVARIVDDHIHKHTRLDVAIPIQLSAARMLRPIPTKLRDGDGGQIEKLATSFGPKLRQFHLRYFGVTTDRGLDVLDETEIEVVDLSAAILAVVEIPWPACAVGLRIVDDKGHPVFERLKSDWQLRDEADR
jgi:hypothetical protein